MPKDLIILRKKLEEIDHELITLIQRRMEISHEIGIFKAEHNISVVDAEQRKKVLMRAKDLAEHAGLDPESIIMIMDILLLMSEKKQQNLRM